MSNVLRLAIVDPNDATREALKPTLLGLDTVWLEAECSRYAFFVDVVKQTNPDVVLVSLDSDTEAALKLIEELSHNSPDLSILVASRSTDGGLILRTMRAGAKEFLTQPLKPEDGAAAVQRVANRATDGELIWRTRRAGAKQFLTQPLKPEDVAAAVQRVAKHRFGAQASGSSGGCKVITMVGATGGVGVTSPAVNMGCALAAD